MGQEREGEEGEKKEVINEILYLPMQSVSVAATAQVSSTVCRWFDSGRESMSSVTFNIFIITRASVGDKKNTHIYSI